MTKPLFAWPEGVLDRKLVVQCALSRVCGGCGRSLGRPIAFVGDPDEVARHSFHAPPLHVDCAEALVTEGQEVLLTAGYEFVRPGAHDPDPRPRFIPNAVL